MNRSDFQEIAEVRLRESTALLAAGFPNGAYYLAGYAIECALKACIAKRTREHDFPEKKLANESHTHDLGKLLDLAKLKTDLEILIQADPTMESALDKVLEWSETSRYETKTAEEASELIEAVGDRKGGLLPWIQRHW